MRHYFGIICPRQPLDLAARASSDAARKYDRHIRADV
jgi:hypothetical protein